MGSSNKDFFRFLSGFMGILCISLVIIFAVSFYESVIMESAEHGQAGSIQK
jgi:hypothetical protein